VKLLDVVNIGGRTEKWYREPDGKITVYTVQDAEPILDANKRAYNEAPSTFGKGAFHKVASIPVTVIEEACRIHQMKLAELVAAKTDKAQRVWNELLNARDLRYFRTRPGRVDLKA
jgi:hypothetical protein